MHDAEIINVRHSQSECSPTRNFHTDILTKNGAARKICRTDKMESKHRGGEKGGRRREAQRRTETEHPPGEKEKEKEGTGVNYTD